MALWIGGISSHKIRAVIWNLRRHSVKLRSINSHHYYHLQIIPYGSEVKLNLRRCLHSDHRSAWYIAQRCRMNFLTFLAPRIELEPRSIVMFLWSDGYWLETSLYSTSSLMWLRHVCVQWLNSDLTNMTWTIPWLSKWWWEDHERLFIMSLLIKHQSARICEKLAKLFEARGGCWVITAANGSR